jgi:hypothetical protein
MQAKSISNMSKRSILDFEYIGFEVERENWNKYRLEDKTILKTKFILINAFAEKGYKEKIQKARAEKRKEDFGFKFQPTTVTGVEAPPNLIGTPCSQRFTIQELESSVVKDDIDFETIAQTWNIYKLADDLVMKVRNAPMSVRRTSKFDSEGLPIYLVDFTADVKIGPRK